MLEPGGWGLAESGCSENTIRLRICWQTERIEWFADQDKQNQRSLKSQCLRATLDPYYLRKLLAG